MAEETLAQPLSGEEVIESVLQRIRAVLVKDCYLSPMAAYEAYSAEVSVTLRLMDVGREAVVDREVTANSEATVRLDTEAVEAFVEIEPAPPNDVRMEAGLPIPTLVETPDGKRTIKNVSYKKQDHLRVRA